MGVDSQLLMVNKKVEELTLGGFPVSTEFWWIAKGGEKSEHGYLRAVVSPPYVLLEDAVHNLKFFGINRSFSSLELKKIQSLGLFCGEDYSLFLSHSLTIDPPHLRGEEAVRFFLDAWSEWEKVVHT